MLRTVLRTLQSILYKVSSSYGSMRLPEHEIINLDALLERRRPHSIAYLSIRLLDYFYRMVLFNVLWKRPCCTVIIGVNIIGPVHMAHVCKRQPRYTNLAQLVHRQLGALLVGAEQRFMDVKTVARKRIEGRRIRLRRLQLGVSLVLGSVWCWWLDGDRLYLRTVQYSTVHE